MRELLCKPKDRVATEDKNNIVYEIAYSNCEAVYFGEPTRSLKSRSDEKKKRHLSGIVILIKMKLLNTVGKQIATLAGVRRKLLIKKTG